MHGFLTFVVLLLVAHAVWEMVFRPAAFAERMADPTERILYAAWLWTFAVEAAALSTPVTLLLKLPSLALFLWLAWQCLKAVWAYLRSLAGKPASPPPPRMSEHELMGLAEDIAMADRLRASPSPADHIRARELRSLAIEQAAGPRLGL